MTNIKGYKVLSEDQKGLINSLKSHEIDLLDLFKSMQVEGAAFTVDKRWLNIARTHLEQAFMAAVRSVAQPETVEF